MIILQIPDDIWEFYIYKYIHKDIFRLFNVFALSSRRGKFLWKIMVRKYMENFFLTSLSAVPVSRMIPIECCYCKTVTDSNHSIACFWDTPPQRVIFTCPSKICEQVTKFIITNEMARSNILLSSNSFENKKFVIPRSNGKLQKDVTLKELVYTDGQIFFKAIWSDEVFISLFKDVLLETIIQLNTEILDDTFTLEFPKYYPEPKKESFIVNIKKVLDKHQIQLITHTCP